ncbi:MAG TPA: 16S rRNA pseudouridine(516) synthase, partial [Bacteroidales bacterium]|nr:16S rRNA pseudouridine(516) synthase [Bacteroidales bacterium]
MPSQRLDKFLSSQLNRTRRDVKADLRRGLVQVNGAAVKQPEYGIDPERDEILYGGQAVRYKEHIYIVMNKPAGVLS